MMTTSDFEDCVASIELLLNRKFESPTVPQLLKALSDRAQELEVEINDIPSREFDELALERGMVMSLATTLAGSTQAGASLALH